MNNWKAVLKKVFRILFARDISRLVVTDNIQFFSFDVFDTLVKRSCYKPENVFEIIAKESNDTSFVMRRIKAEKNAKKITGEVTLDQIYEAMDGYSEEEKRTLKQLEIKTELRECIPNERVVEKFKMIKGPKVILSDMYLPKECIIGILDKCGIHEYEKVFVSCEYNKSKRNGDLFDLVLQMLNVPPQNVLHVGDNPYGDYVIPHRKGMKTFLVR